MNTTDPLRVSWSEELRTLLLELGPGAFTAQRIEEKDEPAAQPRRRPEVTS
jgi:hypothetical protein